MTDDPTDAEGQDDARKWQQLDLPRRLRLGDRQRARSCCIRKSSGHCRLLPSFRGHRVMIGAPELEFVFRSRCVRDCVTLRIDGPRGSCCCCWPSWCWMITEIILYAPAVLSMFTRASSTACNWQQLRRAGGVWNYHCCYCSIAAVPYFIIGVSSMSCREVETSDAVPKPAPERWKST